MSAPTRVLLGGAALATMLVVSACSSADGESAEAAESSGGVTCLPADAQEEVTLGIRSSLVFADIYLAQERGYFKEQGVDMSLEAVDPATALQLASRGDISGVATGLSAGLFNAINSGLDLHPVTSGGNDSEDSAPQFWVRKELVDSGEVTSVEDLKGRKFAMPGIIGGGASQKVGLYLGLGGLTYSDVQLQNIDYPEMPGAFANGSIDAAYVTAGAAGPIEDAGTAVPLGEQQVTLGVNANTIVFGPELVEKRPEVGTAVLRAIMQAREDLAGPYWENSQLVADISRATDIDEENIRESGRASLPADLSFTEDSWESVQELYLAADVLDYDEVMPFEKVAAPEVRERAIESKSVCG